MVVQDTVESLAAPAMLHGEEGGSDDDDEEEEEEEDMPEEFQPLSPAQQQRAIKVRIVPCDLVLAGLLINFRINFRATVSGLSHDAVGHCRCAAVLRPNGWRAGIHWPAVVNQPFLRGLCSGTNGVQCQ